MARNIEMKCEELRPRIKNIKIVFKTVSKDEPYEVKSKNDYSKHVVSDILVGDETGVVFLTLWDEDIEKIDANKIYELSNGYTTIFKGQLRLNIGKYGSLRELEEDIPVDTTKNYSEKVHEKYDDKRRRRAHQFGSGSFWPG